MALPDVGLLGKGCWRIVRVPQNLCLTSLPGVRSMLLFLASRYGLCFRQRHFHVAWNPPLRRARDCPSLPLRVAALPLKLFRSEVPGPRVLSNSFARVISRGPGILSSFSRPSWVVSLVLQNLIGALWSSYGHTRSVFSGSESALHPGPCLGWAYWCITCCVISWLSFQGLG